MTIGKDTAPFQEPPGPDVSDSRNQDSCFLRRAGRTNEHASFHHSIPTDVRPDGLIRLKIQKFNSHRIVFSLDSSDPILQRTLKFLEFARRTERQIQTGNDTRRLSRTKHITPFRPLQLSQEATKSRNAVLSSTGFLLCCGLFFFFVFRKSRTVACDTQLLLVPTRCNSNPGTYPFVHPSTVHPK